MCSGVAWSELEGGQSDVERLRQALASRRPGSVLDLACSLPRAHPQGTVFNYSTVESCVLGAVLAAATGRPLADYCAETIWGPAGMAANGYWALDAEGGLELGGTGVSARLRDVGRFGQLCWRMAKRSVADRSCRPADALSPASPTARPPPSVGCCRAARRDTATTGGRCRARRPMSAAAPFRRPAPSCGEAAPDGVLLFYGRSWHATISTVDTPRYGFWVTDFTMARAAAAYQYVVVTTASYWLLMGDVPLSLPFDTILKASNSPAGTATLSCATTSTSTAMLPRDPSA
jgi:hypothetical protein